MTTTTLQFLSSEGITSGETIRHNESTEDTFLVDFVQLGKSLARQDPHQAHLALADLLMAFLATNHA